MTKEDMARIISSEWGKGDRGFACRAAARIAAEQAKEVEGLVEAARKLYRDVEPSSEEGRMSVESSLVRNLGTALSAFPPAADKEPRP